MRPANQQRVSRRNRRAVNRAVLIVSLVIGALMMAAAIESPAHAWLGWFALVPLFFVIRLWRPVYAALGGGLWGLLIFIFSAVQPAAAITPTVQSLVLLATLPAIYAGLGAAIRRWIGFNPFILGFTWMGVELALGPIGMRAGLLSAAPVHGTIMHWVGGALGYVLVAFLVALVSASLVSILLGARMSLPPRCFPAVSVNHGAPLASQTFLCFPLFAIRPPQPRAPPS